MRYGEYIALEVASPYIAIWDKEPTEPNAQPVSNGFPRGTVLGPVEDVAHYQAGVACQLIVDRGDLPSDYTGTVQTGKVELWVIVWACTLNAEQQYSQRELEDTVLGFGLLS